MSIALLQEQFSNLIHKNDTPHNTDNQWTYTYFQTIHERFGCYFWLQTSVGTTSKSILKKSASARNAICLIKRIFNTTELVHLVTSRFYSILYYNSEVWHLPSLKNTLKESLLSASAKTLKLFMFRFSAQLNLRCAN